MSHAIQHFLMKLLFIHMLICYRISKSTRNSLKYLIYPYASIHLNVLLKAYSNQKCGTCQQKSGIHQVFLNAFCHQNPFAHHIVSNRIQNIACQRRVTGCNITENTDKNKVQHYVGYRCRPCLNRKRAVF